MTSAQLQDIFVAPPSKEKLTLKIFSIVKVSSG